MSNCDKRKNLGPSSKYLASALDMYSSRACTYLLIRATMQAMSYQPVFAHDVI